MIRSLLIANRGEIACRIARTARSLGVRTIAVFSEADADAAHVAAADVAYPIGPAPARESYLRIDAILAAARASGAEAVHPGYGFLSENADFAQAVTQAGIAFVGPPASAIHAMGSKSAAKALMDKAGVPLVPGYFGADQDAGLLAGEAERIGFPVLIKASAGGGGKGMRVVRALGEFADALAGAQREAASSFGDATVLIEKYLTRPRHVEIQVFADAHGNCVYLHDRDCSIQRRHQKVIEEAPAPDLPPEMRRAMGEAAVAAAQAVGYVGAGTVEFVVEDGRFYFIEMNTRLQVEHPVTEAITGLDLVEWQLRVASGEKLPLAQGQIRRDGHAIEARLYAEDPARDFLPQTGKLVHLSLPADLPGARIDAGVRTGDTVTVFYDPMIAKLIAHGRDRAEAVGRLRAMLAASEVAGLATNRAFLEAILGHQAFAAAELDTGFIERHHTDLLPPPQVPGPEVLAAAALAWLAATGGEIRTRQQATADPHSPWAALSGWQPNLAGRATLELTGEGASEAITVSVFFEGGTRMRLGIGDKTIAATSWPIDEHHLGVTLDGVRSQVGWTLVGARLSLRYGGAEYRFTLTDPYHAAAGEGATAGRLVAPMPGRVTAVHVVEGASVVKGTPLIVVEAMKMEHAITASVDGVVTAVKAAVGDLVAEGAELVVLEAAAQAPSGEAA